MAYYLLYGVNTNTGGFAGSSFKLVSDDNGTPESTGTVLYQGTGNVTLGSNLVNGFWKADKTDWVDTVSLTGGGSMEVHVENAGDDGARIWFSREGVNYQFNAEELLFEQSEAFPVYWTLNNSGEEGEPVWLEAEEGNYSPELTSVTAVNPESVNVSGNVDTRASENILKWGTSNQRDGDALTGTTGSFRLRGELPIVIAGLEPSTTYYFQLVASGDFGTAYSSVESVTTNAAGQLTPPSVEIEAGGVDTTKKIVVGDVENADFFDLEIDTSSEFTNPDTVRITNNSGAVYYARGLADGTAYYVRVKSVPGSASYASSSWSDTKSTVVSGTETEEESAGEITFRSNIRLDAVPTASNHLATVGKVTSMVNSAVTGLGTHVNSIAGLTGTVTFAELLNAGGASFVVQGETSTASSVLTASASDSAVVSAKAVYCYVQKVKTDLTSAMSVHYHSYLYAPNGQHAVSAPDLLDDATLLSDEILGPQYETAATYQPGDYAVFQGVLFQNTSGTASTGNADFANKWDRKTILELVQENTGGKNRYEENFTGADLNGDYEILINHGLGEQFVFAEVIETTSGKNNAVIGAQVNFIGVNQLKLTFGSSAANTDSFKVIVYR